MDLWPCRCRCPALLLLPTLPEGLFVVYWFFFDICCSLRLNFLHDLKERGSGV